MTSSRILSTHDGGRTWRSEYQASGAQLRGLDFVDREHGWVVSTRGLLTTADGGAHWRLMPQPCPMLRSVQFVSRGVGFGIAGGSTPVNGVPPVDAALLGTTDGGTHWVPIRGPRDAQTVCFANPQHGWLGADGHLYGTRDGGKSWTLQVRGAYGTVRSPALAEVSCLPNSSQAWAELAGPGGMSSQGPHIGYHSSDGATWTPIFAEQYFPHPAVSVTAEAPGSYPGPFTAISGTRAVFIDFCPACGAGTAPMDLAAAGGTELVSRGNVGDLTSAVAASFTSPYDGWVIGLHTFYTSTGTSTSSTRIVHTADGGRTWHIEFRIP